MGAFRFEDVAMTIVVGMRESDEAMLLAADSEATDEFGLKHPHVKLHQVEGHSLAWGSAGNPTIGDYEFVKWVKQYDWKGKSWDDASKAAQEELARLNGEQRRLTELSRTPMQTTFLCDIIIGGWLNGPNMFALSSDGRITPIWESQSEFRAVGTGAPYAIASYNTLKLGRVEGPENILRMMLIGTIMFAPNCGPPAEAWRIRQDGVTTAFRLENRVVSTPLASQSEPDSSAP